MYESFVNHEGLLSIAGHRFDPVTHICKGSPNGKPCGRHLDDVLSDAYTAKVNDLNVACYGQLTNTELATLVAAYEERKKAISNAMVVRL